ncbi:MAG TPA: Rrf2 family transcriptional regulator [Chloroflexota bacterium]|nr:Rrf2 family transcriptional regulator [Chloroflexota bacterium]
MKISSRAHYGVRAMTELAKMSDRRPLSLTEIAETEQMPLPYLEQLIAPLRRAGLVEGTRGLHGGYRLTRAPEVISVGEIVRVLDGPISLVDCVAEDYVAGACGREPVCLSKGIWGRVKQSIEQVLDSTSLADLLKESELAGFIQLDQELQELRKVAAVEKR